MLLAASIVILSLGCHKNESVPEPQKEGKSSKKWNRQAAQTEYRLIQAETKLAKTEKPYLVLDMKNKELAIRLKGAKVWSYPMDFEEGAIENLDEFVKKFRGERNRFIRPLTEKHLFSSSEKTPDSILSIVGEVVNVDPELLQREIPQRFQISWSPSLVMEVRTEVVGKSTSMIKNTFFEFKQVIQMPFGVSRIVIKMNAAEALTLYRASQPGLPTLLYPIF